MKLLIGILIIAMTIVCFWLDVADTPHIQHVQQARMNYEYTTSSLTTQRKDLNKRYIHSQTAQEQAEILQESRALLVQNLTEHIFPAWYGTSWGFYGMTRTPGEGEIACGTFVVFTLQDVGFQIPTRMAQQPSENIIKNLVGTTDIKRFSNHAPMDKVIEWIQQRGEGIFLVGLDIHVGFILFRNNRITFCHANYYSPQKVVNQEVLEPSPLVDSQYRVLAKLFTDDMLKKWLSGQSFPVTYDYFKQ